MTTTVTVPGASGSTSYTYSSPGDLAVAQKIAGMLFSDAQDGHLSVTTHANTASPDSDVLGYLPVGVTTELLITPASLTVNNVDKAFHRNPLVVNAGGFDDTVIDPSVTGSVTIDGGGSLIAGNTPVTYWGEPSPNPVLIAAGSGNDLISMKPGSTYEIGLGNGNDSVNADGSGTVTGGTGNNIFYVGSTGSQNVVNSNGNNDTINASGGSATINTSGADPLVYGGPGQLVYYGDAPGNPTITGGAGQETLFAGAGQDLTYTDGSNTTAGANILDAGAGNETLNAGSAKYGVQLAAGVGSDVMIGSQGPDTFYGGAGAATMTGNGGSDLFMFGYTANQPGGTDIITDFSSSDMFAVSGYGANAAQNALSTATVSGGSTTVKLADNTTITFLGVTDPTTIHNQSFLGTMGSG